MIQRFVRLTPRDPEHVYWPASKDIRLERKGMGLNFVIADWDGYSANHMVPLRSLHED
jgi:hypothetical protein